MKIVFNTVDKQAKKEGFVFRFGKRNDRSDIWLNKKFMFLDLISLGEKLKGDVTLNLQYVPNRIKLMIVQILVKHIYKFTKYKTNQVKESVIVLKDKKENSELIKNIIGQVTIANFVRDFQNEPANMITPDGFCKFVKKEFRGTKNLKIDVLNHEQILKSGLNLIHEMGKASVNKSRFLIMNYKHEKAKKTFCIVGKGVTFDSGGMNLKTNHMSLEMKSDKSGGCIAVGIMKYIIANNIPCNLIVLVPLIENMIDGDAIHPGDIIKCYNGKTVEVINTDAEGRLIMADAIAYSEHFNIDYLFDMATLTGWTDILHCHHTASYFTTNKKLYGLINEVGESIGERVIGLPIWVDYTRFTRSQVADYKNHDFSCKRTGGFMASMFLYNFVPENLKDKWVHFDISNNFTGHFSNGNAFLLGLNLILRLINDL